MRALHAHQTRHIDANVTRLASSKQSDRCATAPPSTARAACPRSHDSTPARRVLVGEANLHVGTEPPRDVGEQVAHDGPHMAAHHYVQPCHSKLPSGWHATVVPHRQSDVDRRPRSTAQCIGCSMISFEGHTFFCSDANLYPLDKIEPSRWEHREGSLRESRHVRQREVGLTQDPLCTPRIDGRGVSSS